jgi:hypothetical protein
MKTKVKKSDLAQWLVNENNDCGRDTYFTEDRRASMNTEEPFKRFMAYTKEKLVSIIYDFSAEGQAFLEKNNLV